MPNSNFLSTVTEWIFTSSPRISDGENVSKRFADLYSHLHDGVTHFWYEKNDGTLRSAYGTLDMDIIERHGGAPDGDSGKKRPFCGVAYYFDLEKDGWRAFRVDRLREIDFGY